MTLSIEVTPREEAWLAAQAAQLGLLPAVVTQEEAEQPARTIDTRNAAAIALLDSWIAEGANADEETKRQAELELEELKRNLNANRAKLGERLVFPCPPYCP